MQKLIVMDLDGTLLDDNREISIYTKKILDECMAKGIKLVFATARPIRATKIYFSIIKPDAFICHNGANVIVDDKIIVKNGIQKEEYEGILKIIEEKNISNHLMIEINDKIYTNFDPNIYWKDIEYENINDMPLIEADKIIIGIDGSEKLIEINKFLPENLYSEKSIGAKGGLLCLIMNKNAVKWNGIKVLSEHFQIDTKDIIAFGDNENDYEMLKNCGIGIAVDNGTDEAKKISKYICDTNNKDGVAKWIKKNILEKGQNSV